MCNKMDDTMSLIDLDDSCFEYVRNFEQLEISRNFGTSIVSVGDTITMIYTIKNSYSCTLSLKVIEKNFPTFLHLSNFNGSTAVENLDYNITNLSSGDSLNFIGTLLANSVASISFAVECTSSGFLASTNNMEASATIQSTSEPVYSLKLLDNGSLDVLGGSCVHEDTLVQTLVGPKRIADIELDDICLDANGQGHQVAKLVRCGKSKQLVKLRPNSIGPRIPNKQLFISADHPIMFYGQEILPNSLVNGIHVLEHQFEDYQNIYTLVTEQRTFILMNNVQVSTWGQSAFENFQLNDKFGRHLANNTFDN